MADGARTHLINPSVGFLAGHFAVASLRLLQIQPVFVVAAPSYGLAALRNPRSGFMRCVLVPVQSNIPVMVPSILVALVCALAGCNKHSVPEGGRCEVQEDCATEEMLFCVETPSGTGNVRATPCSPPDLRVPSSGCSGGYTCTLTNAAIAGGLTYLCFR